MTQQEAIKIAYDESFHYKDNFDVNLNMRESNLLFVLMHAYHQNEELKVYIKKEMKNFLKCKNTPGTMDKEIHELINKLLLAQFKRDPEKSRIMDIANGNIVDGE